MDWIGFERYIYICLFFYILNIFRFGYFRLKDIYHLITIIAYIILDCFIGLLTVLTTSLSFSFLSPTLSPLPLVNKLVYISPISFFLQKKIQKAGHIGLTWSLVFQRGVFRRRGQGY